MKKIWVKKVGSFRAAKDFDQNYYLSMNSEERLETMQFLREQISKMKKEESNAGGKGLRRIIRIVQ
jgi:hypothetical protein